VLCRLQEEYQQKDSSQAEAAAMFEQELQALESQVADEFGSDSETIINPNTPFILHDHRH